jgi:hypothetical protein
MIGLDWQPTSSYTSLDGLIAITTAAFAVSLGLTLLALRLRGSVSGRLVILVASLVAWISCCVSASLILDGFLSGPCWPGPASNRIASPSDLRPAPCGFYQRAILIIVMAVGVLAILETSVFLVLRARRNRGRSIERSLAHPGVLNRASMLRAGVLSGVLAPIGLIGGLTFWWIGVIRG